MRSGMSTDHRTPGKPNPYADAMAASPRLASWHSDISANSPFNADHRDSTRTTTVR